MTRSQPLIAIVDDDVSVREALAGLIEALGYRARSFASAPEFLASPDLGETHCIIADVQMPGMTGPDMHRRLKERGQCIPIIFVTAYPDETVKARALADGALCYLIKPYDEDELIENIRLALDARAA